MQVLLKRKAKVKHKNINGEPFFSLISQYRNHKSGTNREKEALDKSWLFERSLCSGIYTKAVKGVNTRGLTLEQESRVRYLDKQAGVFNMNIIFSSLFFFLSLLLLSPYTGRHIGEHVNRHHSCFCKSSFEHDIGISWPFFYNPVQYYNKGDNMYVDVRCL